MTKNVYIQITVYRQQKRRLNASYKFDKDKQMAKTVIQLDSIRNKVHTKAVADILPCQLVPLQLIQKSSCLHVITIDIKPV